MPQRGEQAAGTDVHLVRHGETQCYSSDSGLTPLGVAQARGRGEQLAAGIQAGTAVGLASADTRRARQTAEHLRRGLLDSLARLGRAVPVGEVEVAAEFRNFAVATPWGDMDVTAAHGHYQDERERHERTGRGPQPAWVEEIGRFWAAEHHGGDPIAHWLSTPMLHFEPPAACVRRLWAGVLRLHLERPGRTHVVVTHSGPIRAFAAWAIGEDVGEPDNAEAVLVRLLAGDSTALVRYRDRVQEVPLPCLDALPDWWAGLPGVALPPARRHLPAGAS